MDGEKRRKSNFSEREQIIIIEEIKSNENILKPRLGSTVTAKEKDDVWRRITEKLNGENPTQLRTMAEVKKKWNNMTSKMKENLHNEKRQMEKTGGGRPQNVMTDLDNQVLLVVGESSPVIVGICGGADSLAAKPSAPYPSVTDSSASEQPTPPTSSASTLVTVQEKDQSVPAIQSTPIRSKSASIPLTGSGRSASVNKRNDLYSEYLEVEIKRSKLSVEKIEEERSKIAHETQKIILEKELLQLQIMQVQMQMQMEERQRIKQEVIDLSFDL